MANEEVRFEKLDVDLDLDTLKATLKVLHVATGKRYAEGLKAAPLRELLHEEIEGFLDATNPNRFDKVGGFESFVEVLAEPGKGGTCYGVCIDLTKSTCAVCRDQPQCLTLFIENSKDGFVALGKKHGVDLKKEEVAVSAEEPVKKKGKKAKAPEPDDKVSIFDVENPLKPGTIEHSFLQRVLGWGVMTVGDMMTIAKSFLPLASENELLDVLEEHGVGVLAKRLPADYVAGLSKKQRRELGL